MKKWKNEKHSRLPNSIAERAMFLEMQKMWFCSRNIIWPTENNFSKESQSRLFFNGFPSFWLSKWYSGCCFRWNDITRCYCINPMHPGNFLLSYQVEILIFCTSFCKMQIIFVTAYRNQYNKILSVSVNSGPWQP